ncbi:MAG: ATP-binding protein [Clostridia bacterium]|nr:ATP-binding protein [Clostridia bacterium]
MIVALNKRESLLADKRKQSLYIDYPELLSFDKEIASVFQSVMKDVISGKQADFSSAEEKSLELQRKKEEYIRANNIDISVINPKIYCDICSDTGYMPNGKLCDCVRKKAAELNYEELNKDENGVIPRDIMTKICSFCVKYATEFKSDSESLLFFGKTGLGKTHLSLSIANEVIKKGYNVVYGPISRIMGNIEKEHFSDNDRTTLMNILDCDLLIFDDLGTEFTTSFIASTIFDIVNSRILNKKPTIINTNLDFEEIKQRYSDRIVSRIAGNYRMLQFFGEDIRFIK